MKHGDGKKTKFEFVKNCKNLAENVIFHSLIIFILELKKLLVLNYNFCWLSHIPYIAKT